MIEDQFEKDLQGASKVKVDLTKNEVEMFERLMSMETVHNIVGQNLGAYKESIVETRNKFVVLLQKKYKFENPKLVTYDPFLQKIVSVFNPELKAHKIVSSEHAFEEIASKKIMDLVNELLALYVNIKK